MDYEHRKFRAEYVIERNRYFLQHSDYDATASSTLKPEGEHKYDVDNIRPGIGTTWPKARRVTGSAESISLNLHRPLPLDAIMIMPGYRADDATLWSKNNRWRIGDHIETANKTFVAAIPTISFAEPTQFRCAAMRSR